MLYAKAIKPSYECLHASYMQKATLCRMALSVVAGEGFEPSKAEPGDLQSPPIGRSGNPPRSNVLRRVKITSNQWLDVNHVVLAIYGGWHMPKCQLRAGQVRPK